MLPATNRGVGMNMGMPDVCLTPAGPAVAPVPYPNMGMTAMAMPFSATVSVSMCPAVNMLSKIMMTSGDEGGVAHPTIKGPGSFTMGNPVVNIDKSPAINLTCLTTGNQMNNAMGAVQVPSAVNVFYCFNASASEDDGVEHEETDWPRALDEARITVETQSEGLLIRIPLFGSDIPRQVQCALRRHDPSRVVFDLQGCPGGELYAFLELAEAFLEPGLEMVSLVDADGDDVVHRSRGGAHSELPLTVLVDGHTASAAEWFAGCLQAHGRATIVGSPTFGKGVGTTGSLHRAPHTDRTAILPHGRRIHGVGLNPDVLTSSPLAAAQE